MYGRWPRRFGPVELCVVQFPGRENRIGEPHYGTYQRLAAMLAEALHPYLDRPYGVFGHCGAALPGFALALHLMCAGLRPPDRLFMSSQVAPHDGPYGRFLGMSDDELGIELGGLIRAMGGEPHPDLVEMNLGVLRADVAANRAYRLAAPVLLPSTIHAIGWDADTEITPAQMHGWRQYAAPGRFRSTVLPGTHYAFLDPPPVLLDELSDGMGTSLRDSQMVLGDA
jgi:surfactin synthase thioesterase subunit